MSQQLSTNTFTVAKWVVSSDATQGTHTTIAAALTSASSGDTIFIRDGTYTENITGKAGVTLTASLGDAGEPNVTIIGKCTFTTAGSFSISNIKLQTNSDFVLAVTGSAASIVYLTDCNLSFTNNTGISFTTSSSSAQINVNSCIGDLGTTGIALFSHSSAGTLIFQGCNFTNSGGSSTASTASAGTVQILSTFILSPITTSGTNTINVYGSNIVSSATNTTALTLGGSGGGASSYSNYASGTASAISVGSSLAASGLAVSSTNTNAVTGAGTLSNSGTFLPNTGQKINTSSQIGFPFATGGITFDGGTNILQNYAVGTFTPTVVGETSAGTTTYTQQNGYYVRVGSMVQVQANINISAATGTGNANYGALPFTIKNQTNGFCPGSALLATAAGWTWPAGTTSASMQGTLNSTNAHLYCSGTGTLGGPLQMANAANTTQYAIVYEI